MRLVDYLKTNSIRIVMALTLAGYGVAILLRPNASVGTIAFLEASLGISYQAIAIIFISAAIAMATRVHWLHYFALIPLIAYSIASAAFIIPRENLTLVAVVQHISLAILMIVIVERDWRLEDGNTGSK